MKLWSKNKKHHSRYAAVLLSVIMAVMMVLSGCGIEEGHYGETQTGFEHSGQKVQETAVGETLAKADLLRETSDGESGETFAEIPEESDETLDEIPGGILTETSEETISEDGWYSDKDQVALYLHRYGHLPGNYISKSKAQELGWNSQEGNLWDVAPGMSIGGGKFGNREGLLPEEKGRTYYECDIDYDGGYRGAKRIVYSNDGLIYYTEDHYESFELLYGEEETE